MAPSAVVDLTLSSDDEAVVVAPSTLAKRALPSVPSTGRSARTLPTPPRAPAASNSGRMSAPTPAVPAPSLTAITDRAALEAEARKRREERMGQDAEAGPSAPKRAKVQDTSRARFGSINSAPTAGPSGSGFSSVTGASDFELPPAIADEPGKIRLMMSGYSASVFRHTAVYDGKPPTLKRYTEKLDAVECNGTVRHRSARRR